MFRNVFCCFLLFVHICNAIIVLSTQFYTKSSCQLNTAHFQPVNSTLVFSKAAPLQNEKIREPEEYLQLSEILYFQAFFDIQFCTFDSNTTHSTCFDLRNRSSSSFCLKLGSRLGASVRIQMSASILEKSSLDKYDSVYFKKASR